VYPGKPETYRVYLTRAGGRSSRRGGVPICTEMNDLRASGSARPVRRGILVVLLAVLVPPSTLLLLRAVPALDLVLRSAVGHLVVVSAISAWP
jgi:hypothetical protein